VRKGPSTARGETRCDRGRRHGRRTIAEHHVRRRAGERGRMGPAPRAGCVVTARPSASGSSDLIGLVAVHGIACGALALARRQPVAIRIARSPAPSFSSAVTLARPSSTAATGGGSRTTTRKTSTPARGSGRRRRSGNQITRPRAGNRASAHSCEDVDLTGSARRRWLPSQSPVPHARSPAAASHSSRPSIGIS